MLLLFSPCEIRINGTRAQRKEKKTWLLIFTYVIYGPFLLALPPPPLSLSPVSLGYTPVKTVYYFFFFDGNRIFDDITVKLFSKICFLASYRLFRDNHTRIVVIVVYQTYITYSTIISRNKRFITHTHADAKPNLHKSCTFSRFPLIVTFKCIRVKYIALTITIYNIGFWFIPYNNIPTPVRICVVYNMSQKSRNCRLVKPGITYFFFHFFFYLLLETLGQGTGTVPKSIGFRTGIHW